MNFLKRTRVRKLNNHLIIAVGCCGILLKFVFIGSKKILENPEIHFRITEEPVILQPLFISSMASINKNRYKKSHFKSGFFVILNDKSPEYPPSIYRNLFQGQSVFLNAHRTPNHVLVNLHF